MELTLLYYTANLISDFFANNVRNHLLKTANGYPIISVSQKPIDFGENIYVDFKPSLYNCYKQILIGAKKVKTKYVACCEDDTLYNPEHFAHRPSDNTFSYNMNRWNANVDVYYYRNKAGMCACIVPTDYLIKTLEIRLEIIPESKPQVELRGFGEPGKGEKYLGLPFVNRELFKTKHSVLTFNHKPSIGGLRKLLPRDRIAKELPDWGEAKNIWETIHG